MLEKLNNQEKLINYRKLNVTGGNKVDYNFSECRSLKELFKTVHYINITIEKTERIQEESNTVINALKNYKSKKTKYKENKEKLLINAQNFYDGRDMIIKAFKNKIFPKTPTGFEEDVDEDELLKIRHEKDSRLPTYRYKNKLSTIHEEDESPNSSLGLSRSSSSINLEKN